MILGLKQTNTEWLEETLLAVSDPHSPQYGHHISLEEMVHFVHAYPEGVTAVKEVLGSVGIIPEFTLGEGFAVAYIPVSVAENLFSAEFYQYQHIEDARMIVTRSKTYTLPHHLIEHVDFVAGMSDFPALNSHKKNFSGNLKGIYNDTTPDVIDKAYNISGYVSKNSKNSQAIAGFLEQYFSPDDLKSFQTQYNIPLKPIVKVIGKNEPGDPGMEASLDVQYISSTGRNVDTWFVSVAKNANGKQEDFMTWLLELINNTDSPWVHSVSYGDYEKTIDSKYMERVEQEFMKLGVSGRTVIFASGDDGTSCSLTHGGKFEPMWPASSPYVTTVGGTVSMTECWDHSGGGFSNVYQTPAYQKHALETYLKSGLAPDDKYFNKSGRAYPDLSVFAVNFDIVIFGIPWPVDGTSCAAPTTAGIISLLNDVRLNKGQSTLGFINPKLYELAGKGMFDITKVKFCNLYI